MITHPQIKSKYHVETVPGDGIFLLSEIESHVLEGASLTAIVPLLDGATSWDNILAAVEDRVGKDEALAAFDLLTANGHVEEGGGLLRPEFRIFWSELGKEPQAAWQLVRSTPIHVATVGNVDPDSFVRGLESFGFPLADAGTASITAVLADDYQAPGIAAVNAHCLEHGTPWILVKPVGLMPLVGPFFRPRRTACWTCLETRLRHNREVESYIQRRQGRSEPFPVARARLPMAEAQATALALIQLVRWLAVGNNPALESRIVALDILSGEQSSHYVVRRPQCPSCGTAALGELRGTAVAVEGRNLAAAGENGLRVEDPEITFRRFAHHISPLTGVVKSVAPALWHGTGPIRSYVAGHNFALKNDGLYFIKDGLRTASSGKGRSDAQARTSALCEALERFSGLYRGEEGRRIGSLRELGDEAVDPRSVMLFSDTQYDERAAWLARGSRFQVVPRRFEPDASISWSPIWSWTERRTKYLPTSQLYYGFQEAPESFFCWGDSNGNAAGSCIEDAILQGFFEVVERDAVCIWWYNRLRRPAIDLEALGEPYIEEFRAFYASIGREFWVLDLTTDLGIPCCAAINRRTSASTEDIVVGFGAHTDPRVAVSRALTEMNQFMPAVLAVNEAGETQYAFDDRDCLAWWRTATLANQPYLKPAGKRRLQGDVRNGRTADARAQIVDCLGRVEAKGMEVLILDQTRADVGLPVVKVVVPGMRHFWARYAPGRLYDVPVELGWLKQPTLERDLNPVAMFI